MTKEEIEDRLVEIEEEMENLDLTITALQEERYDLIKELDSIQPDETDEDKEEEKEDANKTE